MKNDHFFYFLQKGSDIGLYEVFNVTQDFKEYLQDSNVYNSKEISNWRELPDSFLSPLTRNNFMGSSIFIQIADDVVEIPNNWSDLITIRIYLKPEGLLFLYKKLEIDAMAKANKWNGIRSWVAIIVACIAAVFTGWPLFNRHNARLEETKSPSVKLTTTPLQKQSTSLKKPNKDTIRKSPSY